MPDDRGKTRAQISPPVFKDHVICHGPTRYEMHMRFMHSPVQGQAH